MLSFPRLQIRNIPLRRASPWSRSTRESANFSSNHYSASTFLRWTARGLMQERSEKAPCVPSRRCSKGSIQAGRSTYTPRKSNPLSSELFCCASSRRCIYITHRIIDSRSNFSDILHPPKRGASLDVTIHGRSSSRTSTCRHWLLDGVAQTIGRFSTRRYLAQ